MNSSKKIHVTPVVLCGGSGTRLWPLSRSGFPKQFLVLSGITSLFQQALERLKGLAADDIHLGDMLVVTGEEHRFLALDQLRELKDIRATLLLEPMARNTAPALTLASLQAIKDGDDPVLVVMPADQTIQNIAAFTDAVQRGIRVASDGAIVILGVTPDKPETGYGYVKLQGGAGDLGEYSVANFVEKPDQDTAKKYLESGDYLWNGGMFLVHASVWLAALKKFRLDIFEATNIASNAQTSDLSFVRPDKTLFADVPSESIDYAVMEHCPGSEVEIKVMPLNAGWNDLGAWDAVWHVGNFNADGNVTTGDVMLVDTVNTLVHSSSRLVSTVGVENLVIIETADAVLVADKNQSQAVKKIVNQLAQSNRQEDALHRKVHRPWGWYDTIDAGEHFRVKRIMVKPGASLSLQKHQKRAEHWVVVDGEAEVTCGDEVIKLKQNESTFIPQGEVHRLANNGSRPLEIIEVQSGTYFGEDDIIRIDDIYGRN